MKIYDSLQKKKVEFNPIRKDEVKMYVCGVTPYDYAHIGNARPAIVFDTLYRFLKASGNKVKYVRNFTDVDDKIIKRANEQEVDWKELTENFMRIYHEDMARLNVYSSDDLEKFPHNKNNKFITSDIVEPLVTGHMEEIISMIKTLLDNGHAYVGKSGDVLYSTETFADYGKLSGNCLDSLNLGQRVAVTSDKNHETDFVLWKSVKENEPMQWAFDYTDKDGNSVNPGRPGWHIECSAMSKKHLGETFDIHGGGEDLKFPHHECEIAQSKGSHDGDFAHYWMHNAFINVDGEKMSKSLGNFKTIHSVLEKYSGEAVRLWMLSTHYRKPVDLTEEALQRAEDKITSWYWTLQRGLQEDDSSNYREAFAMDIDNEILNSLSDDLNTAQAITVLDATAKAINSSFLSEAYKTHALCDKLIKEANILGLLQQDPEEFLKGDVNVDVDIDALVTERDNAKASKNWALADRIRDELNDMGIILEDGANGTTWRKA